MFQRIALYCINLKIHAVQYIEYSFTHLVIYVTGGTHRELTQSERGSGHWMRTGVLLHHLIKTLIVLPFLHYMHTVYPGIRFHYMFHLILTIDVCYQYVRT